MATECRAKNPKQCRVHGNSLISDLQAQADQAAKSGNIETYMNLRQKIDEAHELRSNLEEESPHTDLKIEEAAAGWFEYVGGGRKWLDVSPQTRNEFRRDAEMCLSAAEPHMENGEITPAAINAAARKVYIASFGPDALDDEADAFESGFSPETSPYYTEISKTILNSAKSGKR